MENQPQLTRQYFHKNHWPLFGVAISSFDSPYFDHSDIKNVNGLCMVSFFCLPITYLLLIVWAFFLGIDLCDKKYQIVKEVLNL